VYEFTCLLIDTDQGTLIVIATGIRYFEAIHNFLRHLNSICLIAIILVILFVLIVIVIIFVLFQFDSTV
jgi:hypothetical protein